MVNEGVGASIADTASGIPNPDEACGGGGSGFGSAVYGGSTNDSVGFMFRQGSVEWLLWELVKQVKALRVELAKRP